MRTAIGRLGRGLRQTRAAPISRRASRRCSRHCAPARPVSDLARIEGINPTLLSRIVAKLEERSWWPACPIPTTGAWATSPPPPRAGPHEQIRDERTDALAMAIEGLSAAELERRSRRHCPCSNRSPRR